MAETAVVLQNLNVPSWVFLSFRRGGLHFFRDLVGRISWETLLAGKGADLSGQPVQSMSSITMCRKTKKMVGGKQAWAWNCCFSLNASSEHQEGGNSLSGQEQCRSVSWTRKDAGKKVKAQLEWWMWRAPRSASESTLVARGRLRKIWAHCCEHLLTKGMVRPEVLKAFSGLAFSWIN